MQDVELANAMNQFRSSGGASDYIAQRRGELYNTVSSEHSDSIAKVFGDLQRATDTTKNILYYHVRNKDLDRLQNSIVDQAAMEAANATYDNHNSKRQFEINQWTSENKLDTVFVLQMAFIYLTLTAAMIYGLNAGMIPSSVFYGVTGILSIAVVLTLIVRYQYTAKTRDNRLWNRRRFAKMGPPVMPNCPAVTGMVADFMENTAQQIDDLESQGKGMVQGGAEYLAERAAELSGSLRR
jgi:hypothetical protein